MYAFMKEAPLLTFWPVKVNKNKLTSKKNKNFINLSIRIAWAFLIASYSAFFSVSLMTNTKIQYYHI